tara:strand:- start:267 stop:941 length:675 start_codon:yes stop_codon:yes gene_type:complete
MMPEVIATAYLIYLSLFSLLGLIVTIVIYFMARKDEKRTGETMLSGKSAIIFTSMNGVAWVAFIGLTMMLLAFVLPEMTKYDESIDDYKEYREWMPFRIGFVLLTVSTGAMFALGMVWQSWSRKIWSETSTVFPAWNMFVKGYSGLNVFYLLSTVFYLVVFILGSFVELAFNDNVEWEGTMDTPIKISVMSLISATIFLVLNFWVYSRTTDQVVPLARRYEVKE